MNDVVVYTSTLETTNLSRRFWNPFSSQNLQNLDLARRAVAHRTPGPTMRGVSPRQYFLRVILAAVLCRALKPAARRAPVSERLVCAVS